MGDGEGGKGDGAGVGDGEGGKGGGGGGGRWHFLKILIQFPMQHNESGGHLLPQDPQFNGSIKKSNFQ